MQIAAGGCENELLPLSSRFLLLTLQSVGVLFTRPTSRRLIVFTDVCLPNPHAGGDRLTS